MLSPADRPASTNYALGHNVNLCIVYLWKREHMVALTVSFTAAT